MRNIGQKEQLSRKKTGNYSSCCASDGGADKKDVEAK